MKIRLMIFSVMVVAGLRGSEPHTSLGVFYPNSSKPLITATSWDTTKKEIDFITECSLINAKPFPEGKFIYVISENIGHGVEIKKFEYDVLEKKYNRDIISDYAIDPIDLQLKDCSYVVYNTDGLSYDSLSRGADFINELEKEKVRCVIQYPANKRSLIATTLIRDKKVHYIECWSEFKDRIFSYSIGFGVLGLAGILSYLVLRYVGNK